MAKRKLSYSQALKMMLDGESVSARDLTEFDVSWLRHTAWNLGYSLRDSGIMSYRSYSFERVA